MYVADEVKMGEGVTRSPAAWNKQEEKRKQI